MGQQSKGERNRSSASEWVVSAPYRANSLGCGQDAEGRVLLASESVLL